MIAEEEHKPLIPTDNESELEKIFDTATGMSRFSFERVGRDAFISSEIILKLLYHFGASLINSGTAYLNKRESYVSEGRLIISKLLPSNNEEKARQTHLLYLYGCNKKVTVKPDIDTLLYNPYHALFVIKIALDNLPLTIRQNLHTLADQASPHRFKKVTFPNHSDFYNPLAARAIIGFHSQALGEVMAASNSLEHMKLWDIANFEGVAEVKHILELDVLKAPTKAHKDKIVEALKRYAGYEKTTAYFRKNRADTLKAIELIENATSFKEIDTIIIDYQCKSERNITDKIGRIPISSYFTIFFGKGTEKQNEQKLREEQQQKSGFWKALQEARTVFNALTEQKEQQEISYSK